MSWYMARIGWVPGRLPAVNPEHLASSLPIIQDVTFVFSLSWILYRIWQIYQKPVDELVDLLGLDIPSTLDVSLAGITSDSVLLYWKPAENQSASLRNVIQVNGIKVGDFGPKDTSVQVTGLRPGQYYNIRVISTNSANFSTLGPLIRVQTVPAIGKEGNNHVKSVDEEVEEQTDEFEPASVRAGPTQFGSAVHTLNHQAAKEASTHQGSTKRIISGRRTSPATSIGEVPSMLSSRAASVDEEDSEEAIQRLTDQLDRLRQEQHDTDRQVEDEDREHLASIAELTKNRDHLKQALKEKEEATTDLKKHGGQLDKMNRSAQSRKATKERILHQKQAERQKVKDDIDRWGDEMVSMRQEGERMAQEMDRLLAAKDTAVAQIRETIATDHGLIKDLEDDIRTKGIQIKSMEKGREVAEGNHDDESLTAQDVTNSDQAWEVRAQLLQTQLATAWQAVQQVESENQQAQERVSYWTSRRSRDPHHFASLSHQDHPIGGRPTRPWRNRQGGSRGNVGSLPFNSYQGPAAVPYNPLHPSPHFASASPFFNMSNGMTVPENVVSSTSEQLAMSSNDSDIMAGGGPMSPTANDLLPSNLFRDEDNLVQESPVGIRHGSSSGGTSEWTDTHAHPVNDTVDADRRTPGSIDSRRGSLLSSPHGSIHHVQSRHSSGDAFADNDHLSIHSAGASGLSSTTPSNNLLGNSRLAQLFPNFSRQRGKSSARDPPALGTLRQGQSQSFPRNMEQEQVSTSLESRRRRGSYGNWGLPVASFLNRSGSGADEVGKDSSMNGARNVLGTRSRLNMFGTRADTEGPPTFHERSTSRPSSMYSFDQIAGRRSGESQRFGGWSVAESTPNRSSPLGANWATSAGPWSRIPSRRPSVQHGSTSNLSLGSTPLDPEVYDNPLVPQRSEQMPIGTRPRSSQRASTPRLNPAAPTFKTIFGRSETRKAAKAEKASEKAAEKERAKEAEKANAEESASVGDESSSSLPRLSRDAGSITTAGSVAESHDSLDHSTSGTASEAAASTSTGTRESLMQKITRKSSSSKFNVPWGKERGGLFSKKAGEPSTPDEVEEDAPNENLLSRSGDSAASTPQQEKTSRSSLSWPNIRRKSRKGGLVIGKGDEDEDE
ncbi:MAG: hypothetical protein Q9174_001935 [Haloplaca sp. 1 TL-2023]